MVALVGSRADGGRTVEDLLRVLEVERFFVRAIATAHIYDGSHLLLETHAAECAELMRAFVLDNA